MSIPYTLIRSQRKSIQIAVDAAGAVTVRAPLRASKRLIEDFLSEKSDWIACHVAAQQARAAAVRVLTPAETELLRQAARESLPALTAQWATRMGVAPTAVRITAAAHRWGSCSGRDGICYSLRVMLLPPLLREYIVVHELSHIRQKNHSAAFYDELGRWLPDYVARQAALRAWEQAHPLRALKKDPGQSRDP